jgi:hypothetical protein
MKVTTDTEERGEEGEERAKQLQQESRVTEREGGAAAGRVGHRVGGDTTAELHNCRGAEHNGDGCELV